MLDYAPARKAVEAALRQMTDLLGISTAMAVQGERARGQIKNLAMHLARLLVLASVGGHPPEEPPKKNNNNDKHWWSEIKASLKNFFQATKGASRKQILRELLKDYSEAQIAEIEAALAHAEELMGENIGKVLPPP
jgi:multidrug resistance efflux pump